MSGYDYERACENCDDDMPVEGQVLCLDCLETQTFPRPRSIRSNAGPIVLTSRPSRSGAEVNLVLAMLRSHVGEPAPNGDDLLEALWVVEIARMEWDSPRIGGGIDPAIATRLASSSEAREESVLADSIFDVLELLDVDDAQDAIVHAEAVLVRLLRMRGDA